MLLVFVLVLELVLVLVPVLVLIHVVVLVLEVVRVLVLESPRLGRHGARRAARGPRLPRRRAPQPLLKTQQTSNCAYVFLRGFCCDPYSHRASSNQFTQMCPFHLPLHIEAAPRRRNGECTMPPYNVEAEPRRIVITCIPTNCHHVHPRPVRSRAEESLLRRRKPATVRCLA